MVLAEDSSENEDLVATDWRGNEIKVGTRVIWRNNGWGIGKVVAVRREMYSRSLLLSVLWEERYSDHTRIGNTGHGIRPYHCTALPIGVETDG